MKKTAATTLMVLAFFGGGMAAAGAASAAPMSQCEKNHENFTRTADGRCISDGKFEKINDDKGKGHT